MNLIARKIIYNGSFDSIYGWYIGIGKYNNIVQPLHIATLDQENWVSEFNKLKFNLYDLITKKFNAKYMYGVYIFKNEQIAKEAAEWIESMLVMGKML